MVSRSLSFMLEKVWLLLLDDDDGGGGGDETADADVDGIFVVCFVEQIFMWIVMVRSESREVLRWPSRHASGVVSSRPFAA